MLFSNKTSWKLVGFVFILVAVLILTVGCEDRSDNGDSPGGDFSTDGNDGSNSCLDVINNYTPGRGPFSVKRDTSGSVKMWVPKVPSGCKVPIVHLANGTGGMCMGYSSILNNLAEYGFLAICYESMNTGQGTQAITAVERAIREHADIADADKIGFTGHSQGGGGAIMGVYRAEQKWGMGKTYSGLAMQPASGFGNSPMNWSSLYGKIHSPVSMFNGTADILVSALYVRLAYNALPKSTPKVWYTATGMGSTHVPIPTGPTKEMSVPWFRWTLLGDTNACESFKAMPKGSGWRLAESANLPECR